MQKLSTFGGPYLPHHWSDWPKILDLVLWVPKQHVYQVSLKSETVGFKFSVIVGDLTRNDPITARSLLNIRSILKPRARFCYPVRLLCFSAPSASREELMAMTVAEIVKELIEAHETGKDVNLNKLVSLIFLIR